MATEKVVVPDFGDVQTITVVEVYVSPGDTVEVEDPLIALESEKAVMDIPSPAAGVVKEVYLKEEAVVKGGDAIVLLELSAADDAGTTEKVKESKKESGTPSDEPQAEVKKTDEAGTAEQQPQPEGKKKPAEAEKEDAAPSQNEMKYHATPSLRAYARELEIDLALVTGSGPKGRILKEDVLDFVKKAMKGGTKSGVIPGFLEDKPLEDFSKYGETEQVPQGRIKKISGPHLHRSWVGIPHVTHFDEADVTELEKFRKQMNEETAEGIVRYSPLVFIVKAVVATLKEFPLFNCSLVPGGDTIILKHFYNIGIAVDTPQGLVVPVIKEADQKGIKEIAVELKNLSEAARQSKLSISDLQGATFTISSLGGIGGTGFTPIINGPQVAILGLSRNFLKPVWEEEAQRFIPRLTLPFSLSYDHRVIDGAEAARYCKALGMNIEDLRRALL